MSARQQVLPGLPGKLHAAAERRAKRQEREATRCGCWALHGSGLSADPCFCDCHPEPYPPVEQQMMRDQ